MKHTIKMTNNRFVIGILAIALVFGMMVVGCPTEESAPAFIPLGPPSSVGDYSNLEPAMAPNPNRAIARAGGETDITIPGYLLPTAVERAAGVTATFEVHPDDRNIAQIISQNGTSCKIRGLQLGSARINVSVGVRNATMIIAVSPNVALYTLPAGSVRTLGSSTFYSAWWNSNKPDNLPNDYENYTSEPTYQIAWNWRNPSTSYGASGTNCGIDLLAYYVDPEVSDRRGWVRTTYGWGGWHYDLNGVSNQMTNGVQTNGNVRLELIPEFVYDNGIPYLQIHHILTNTGLNRLTGQKFGASADIMIYGNDRAPLTYLQYGALMTDQTTSGGITYLPKIKFRLVCQNVQGVDNVSTLWLGTYGSERQYVYENKREDVTNRDSAMNFSYQNIDLDPGQSKIFVVRFTQVQ
jgi:hypothetical protein